MYFSVLIIYLLMEEKIWGLRNERTYNTNMSGQYFLTWKFFREFLGAWNLLTNMAYKKVFLKYTYLKNNLHSMSFRCKIVSPQIKLGLS